MACNCENCPCKKEEVVVTSNDLNMVRYFFEEKGDPTRYVAWEKVAEAYPSIAKAWAAIGEAKEVFKVLVNAAENNALEAEDGED